MKKLDMTQHTVGNPYAAIPCCRGAVIPLTDWKRASECFKLLRDTSPHIALGRKLYCTLRAPGSVRNAGSAVERAAT
eukprot:3960740-Alexandrium_andersonii.AAC.1